MLIKKKIMTFYFYESMRVTVKSNKQLKLLLFEVNKLNSWWSAELGGAASQQPWIIDSADNLQDGQNRKTTNTEIVFNKWMFCKLLY